MPLIGIVNSLILKMAIKKFICKNFFLNLDSPGHKLYSFDGYKMGFPQIVGILLFCYASYQQFSIHKQLASYRKGINRIWILFHKIMYWFDPFPDFKKNDSYFLPCGGLFEYVSCPNFFCEILIYLSFFAMFGFSHLPWGIVCIFVILNQVIIIFSI